MHFSDKQQQISNARDIFTCNFKSLLYFSPEIRSSTSGIVHHTTDTEKLCERISSANWDFQF